MGMNNYMGNIAMQCQCHWTGHECLEGIEWRACIMEAWLSSCAHFGLFIPGLAIVVGSVVESASNRHAMPPGDGSSIAACTNTSPSSSETFVGLFLSINFGFGRGFYWAVSINYQVRIVILNANSIKR